MKVIEKRSGGAGTQGSPEVSQSRPSWRAFGCAFWHPPSSRAAPTFAGRQGPIGATRTRNVPHLKGGALRQGRSNASLRRGNRH